MVVTGRRAEPLKETVAPFPRGQWLVAPADQATAEGAATAVHAAESHWGRLDVVLANADLSEPGTIEQLDEASWRRMRSINLDGLIMLARASVPALRTVRGTFIAVSSIAGFGGDWNQTGYNATKGAVNTLVQSMALDLGRHGIRVNAIAPGFISTQLTQPRLDDPAFWALLRERLALERPGFPEDVARAALFLAGDEAGYISGVVLPVDGGITASTGTPRPPTAS